MTDNGNAELEPITALAQIRKTGTLPVPDPTESNLQYVEKLMELLPPQTDDVIDAIAGKILAAPTQADENMLWEATGSKDAAGRRFIFNSVHLQPSDHEDSLLPYYLVCMVTDPQTGEKGVVTTGSINIMVALVKAQLFDELPWEAEICAPKRAPKNGRIPLHLRWIAKIVQPHGAGVIDG